MQLTEHFSFEELIASETAIRKGIDNTPPNDLMPNLQLLAEGLERVRTVLRGKPIHVNSGYRCLELNLAVGGSEKSLHMHGLAADIICPQFGSPLEICRAIAGSGIEFDQIIHEFGGWCHLSFSLPGAALRRELLTIAKAGARYDSGLNPVV
jgi:hypothetical protein